MDFVVTHHKSSSVGAVSSSRDWKWWDWWGCVWMCVVQRLQTQEILSAQCSNLNPDPGKHLMLCITSDQMTPPLWLDVTLAVADKCCMEPYGGAGVALSHSQLQQLVFFGAVCRNISLTWVQLSQLSPAFRRCSSFCSKAGAWGIGIFWMPHCVLKKCVSLRAARACLESLGHEGRQDPW